MMHPFLKLRTEIDTLKMILADVATRLAAQEHRMNSLTTMHTIATNQMHAGGTGQQVLIPPVESSGSAVLVADGSYEVEPGAVDGIGLDPLESKVSNEPGTGGHTLVAYLANALHVAIPDGAIFPEVCLTAAVTVRDNTTPVSGSMTFKFYNGDAYPVAVLAD